MVNDALRARGRDESLREGEGYFYFGGGEAVNWLTSSVMVAPNIGPYAGAVAERVRLAT